MPDTITREYLVNIINAKNKLKLAIGGKGVLVANDLPFYGYWIDIDLTT